MCHRCGNTQTCPACLWEIEQAPTHSDVEGE
jgi:hypothetical protein